MKQDCKNLTNEELVSEYQRTQDEAVLSELMAKNEGLIALIAREYTIPNYDIEDLVEEGRIVCWEAANRFEQRGCTFSTCLRAFLKQRYNRIYVHETRKSRFTGSTPESLEWLTSVGKDGSVESREFMVVGDYSNVEIEEFLSSLKGTTKKVIMNLINGFSKKDTAYNLGIKQASVSYHMSKLQTAYMAYARG